VCAETGKNAGVPGTPQRHLGNSALGIPGPLYLPLSIAIEQLPVLNQY